MAENPGPTLPGWKILEFEQQAFWATAQSRIEINQASDSKQQWQLTADSSIVSNSEQVKLELDPINGRVIKRSRLSRGKQQRYKTFDYLTDYIVRTRREPGADPNQAPTEWTVSNSQKIAYPELANDMVITNAYALLLLAGRFQAGSDESAEIVVHTDFNFYQVRMARSADTAITVDYQVAGTQVADAQIAGTQIASTKNVTGMHDMRTVTLEASPLGTLADKPDFSLLGLYGPITLLFDKEFSIPIQLRGTAPRLGHTEINLRKVTLRESGE